MSDAVESLPDVFQKWSARCGLHPVGMSCTRCAREWNFAQEIKRLREAATRAFDEFIKEFGWAGLHDDEYSRWMVNLGEIAGIPTTPPCFRGEVPHNIIDDQCNKPEHRYCLMCGITESGLKADQEERDAL